VLSRHAHNGENSAGHGPTAGLEGRVRDVHNGDSWVRDVHKGEQWCRLWAHRRGRREGCAQC